MDEGSELDRLRALVANLEQALETRDVTATAKGLLMCRGSCSEHEAFTLLVTQSQHQNVKLVEIARALIDEHHQRVRRLS